MDEISKKLASITRDKRYVVLSKDELLSEIPQSSNTLHVNKRITLAISKYIHTDFYILLTCKDVLREKLTYTSIVSDTKIECFLLFYTQKIQKYLKNKEYHLIENEFQKSIKKVDSYRGYYINLTKDTHRNKAILENLKELNLNHYERFDAYDGTELLKEYQTELDRGSLGCGFSHKGILEQNIDCDRHLHILEDDAILHKYLPNIFDSVKEKIEWDIIYTDIYFSFLSPASFYIFHEKYKLYKQKGDLSVLNLKGVEFSGASSYFVNKKSIKKLHNFLSADWYKYSKHDSYINTLVQKGELNAYVIVPFVSTLSHHSENSTIDEKYSSNMLAMDTLRKAFYIDAPLQELSKKLENEIKKIESSDMLDIYTNSTKISLDNLDKKIDTKTIFLS